MVWVWFSPVRPAISFALFTIEAIVSVVMRVGRLLVGSVCSLMMGLIEDNVSDSHLQLDWGMFLALYTPLPSQIDDVNSPSLLLPVILHVH